MTVSWGLAEQAISKGGGCYAMGFVWPLQQPQLKLTVDLSADLQAEMGPLCCSPQIQCVEQENGCGRSLAA